MVAFTAVNLKFLEFKTTENKNSKQHKFNHKIRFRCEDTNRVYTFYLYSNDKKPPVFTRKKLYRVNGYINVAGFLYFLVIGEIELTDRESGYNSKDEVYESEDNQE